ncbi:MAG: TetR/AcrR family transcriptional regulator [Sphingosinicella sp.]|nr:TetR/AcrR family transcriptional regulator [Sphingosinicella sp.]
MKIDLAKVICGEKKNAAQRLSESAKELFYKRGIRAVGVDEIVNHAGVTKPSLYRSFASKDDLITSCLREHAEDGRARWEKMLALSPGDPRRQLSNVIQSYGEIAASDDFRGCAFVNAAVEFPDPAHPAHEYSCKMKVETRDNFLALIRQLPVAQPDTLADGLMLLLEGAQAARHTFCGAGPTVSLVEVAEALIDTFMDAPAKA